MSDCEAADWDEYHARALREQQLWNEYWDALDEDGKARERQMMLDHYHEAKREGRL
jgi:DUF971 family protein